MGQSSLKKLIILLLLLKLEYHPLDLYLLCLHTEMESLIFNGKLLNASWIIDTGKDATI